MIYLRKIINVLNKSGKKSLAVKTVSSSVERLRKYIVPSKLSRVFEMLLPSVKFTKKKVSGKVYLVPWYITKELSTFQLAKWFQEAIKLERKGRNLSVKLSKVILEAAKNKGNVLKIRKQFLGQVKENRSYMRFIRKKKKKRKISRTFDPKYSNRVVAIDRKADTYGTNKNQRFNDRNKNRLNSKNQRFNNRLKFNDRYNFKNQKFTRTDKKPRREI